MALTVVATGGLHSMAKSVLHVIYYFCYPVVFMKLSIVRRFIDNGEVDSSILSGGAIFLSDLAEQLNPIIA